MKKKSVIIIFVVIAVSIFSIDKEMVGVDQVGFRTFLGTSKVIEAGESVFVLPFVSRFIKMTTKPVLFMMDGKSALSIPGPDGKPVAVECKVRYQITDAAAFVDHFGMGNPDKALEDLLRAKAREAMLPEEGQDSVFDSSMGRMLMSAQLLHDLNSQDITPGVQILSFELLNW